VITAADIALDAIVVAPNIADAVFTVRGHCFWMSWCRFFWVSPPEKKQNKTQQMSRQSHN
jgi:hypothetical protein